jgi:hypothetical protein
MKKSQSKLNPIAQPFLDRLVAAHPNFKKALAILPGGHFETSIAAPKGSAAGAMICRSFDGGIWIRLGPPNAAYPVETAEELLAVVSALFKEQVLLAVISRGEDWIGTTLIEPDATPPTKRGQSASIYSWSGKLDAIVNVAVKKAVPRKKAKPKAAAKRPSKRARKRATKVNSPKAKKR